jgi:hypothetical protein
VSFQKPELRLSRAPTFASFSIKIIEIIELIAIITLRDPTLAGLERPNLAGLVRIAIWEKRRV